VSAGDYRSFVIADIPGIIEGAHEGKGLGIQFLRHIERTNVICYVVDISSDVENDYRVIRGELEEYSEKLAQRKHFILLNKIDLLPKDEVDEKVAILKEIDPETKIVSTSGVTGEGLNEFLEQSWRMIKENSNNTDDNKDIFNTK
jgi:GTP-binding protein